MSKKTIYTILKLSGFLLMILAFIVVPDTKPWYYQVLVFDIGLLLFLIPKFPKIKREFFNN